MPITEPELEAAKDLLRAEFKLSLEAALQELSVQIQESHNRVGETAKASFARAFESAQDAGNTHDETLKAEVVALCQGAAAEVIQVRGSEREEAAIAGVNDALESAKEAMAAHGERLKDQCRQALGNELEIIRRVMATPIVVPAPTGDGELLLRLEKQRLYLDDLADRLGHPRMEGN